MRPTLLVAVLAATAFVAAPVAAHGDLTIHELETLAIRDFEGHEDSFPWEGFEIWDVYVGDGYNFLADSDGVYFKVNFAGDGTARHLQGSAWTIDVSFRVGDQAIQRQITHDGAAVTTTFEALEWTVADGNVFQIKAWTPVAVWEGQAVRDIVIVSSVDGKPRDTAPGGIHDPATGQEVPVEAPSTVIFPPMGEGRIVEEVPLTGPEKYMDVTVAPKAAGVFEFTVKNPLAQQGQHVHFREPVAGAWSVGLSPMGTEVEGGKSVAFTMALNATPINGTVEPLVLDLYSDIGGRHLYYAYLQDGEVQVTDDLTLAKAATVEPAQEAPAMGILAAVALLGAACFRQKRKP